MTDYIGLIQGRLATTNALLGEVLSWLRDVRPGTPALDGHGDYVDAWRHGGTAALLAYHHGYDNVKRWGEALEDYSPDNEWEFRQDVRNNEIGAKIGALARITGMTIPELGDAVKAAFKAGAFQTDAYAPFSGGPTLRVGNMTLSVGSGIVTLADGSRFDLTKSAIVSDGDHEYPLLHVIRKDGSVQDNWTNMQDSRTLFQNGIGKWELPQSGDARAAGSLQQDGWLSPTLPSSLSAPWPTSSMFSSTPIAKSFPAFGGAIGTGNITSLNQTSSMPWYSSPAVTGSYTPTDNFSWNVPTSSFGNRGASPAGDPGNTPSTVPRTPQKDRRSAAPDGPAPTLARGTLPATAAPQAAFAGMMPPDLGPPVPAPQPGPPLGIFSDRPMPSWTAPPPVGGLLNSFSASGNNNGFNLLAGLVSRNSTPPEPPQQTAGSMPERRLGRSTYSVSPAPAYDPGGSAASLVPSDDASYSGGLLGKFAGKAGIDQQDPNQPAQPDDEREQADLQALEDRFASSGSIGDAWALYKARMASQR